MLGGFREVQGNPWTLDAALRFRVASRCESQSVSGMPDDDPNFVF